MKTLNDKPIKQGDYVLYWMQQSQRAEQNPALEFAVDRANELEKPLVVLFSLMKNYPEANARHYLFMIGGLVDVAAALAERKIKLVVRTGEPFEVLCNFAERATLVVCDRGYLLHQKNWRKKLAQYAPCRVEQVEGDVIVPVETVTNRAEIAARTIRPKLFRHLKRFLVALDRPPVKVSSMALELDGFNLNHPQLIVEHLKLDRSVESVGRFFKGGNNAAKRVFRHFLQQRLPTYAAHRALPETDEVSHMSMYLHFGHVSPVWLVLELQRHQPGGEDSAAYLDELLIRRELSQNFVNFTEHYDHYESLPGWAQQTLDEHRTDKRPYVYSREELEQSETHDPYWNAAMREMTVTGYMHNRMRMYWGKKIIEWTKSPEDAFRMALYLNNKYFLDGRDPTSYANVAWLFGLHDRPFYERPIFGKVRWMSPEGLKRKCDIESYVRKIKRLEGQARGEHPDRNRKQLNLGFNEKNK